MKIIDIKPGKYDRDSRQWRYISNNHDFAINATSIKLITDNVWFSDEYIDERSKALLKILDESDADCIALQEVTYHFIQLLLMKKWVQNDYYVSDIRGDTFGSYGVIFLSRFPIKKLSICELPSDMERIFLVAELGINQESMSISTVHLESMEQSADLRAEQLGAIFPLLANSDSSVLMGDLNFCSSAENENRNIDATYCDSWEIMRPGEPGYTMDSSTNRMLSINTARENLSRIDRILFRQQDSKWALKKITLLGTSPITESDTNIFPSDHFGLLGELEW